MLDVLEQKLADDLKLLMHQYEEEDELVQGCKTAKRKQFHETSRSMIWARIDYINELKRFIEIEKAKKV
jgi:hypothetical protein